MKHINVVIPMAGLGSRFVEAGYSKPKPFIDVKGIPMIIRVIENLRIENAHYYLIARKEHLLAEAHLVSEIEKKYNVTFIGIDQLTEGTACTVLYARKYINNQLPLLIANSDQIVDIDINEFIEDNFLRNLDGSILTFRDAERNPKWSFAKVDNSGLVLEVKEKQPISDLATVGIYLFSRGADFVNSTIDMIIHNERVNNEFYTCPVYNYLIAEDLKIGVYTIDQCLMHGLGTPSDLIKY